MSPVSQADADAHARTYFDSTKQAYANSNGSCQPTNPQAVRNCHYDTASGCFSGQMDDGKGNLSTATFQECQACTVPTDNTGGPCIQQC